MWERSHKCNLHLGDLWTMLTIEWATLSSWRQMGSVKTKRIRQVGTQNLPYPLDPFDVLYAPAWISTLKGQHNRVSYCCCICLRRGHFSHLLALGKNWTKFALGTCLLEKNNRNTWCPCKAYIFLFFVEKLNLFVCCLFPY